MFSVTSETTANLSLQNAPSRSARADQSPASDSFSALIDSNAADTAGNDRPAAPERASPQQRPDDTSAASDNRQPRDIASSSGEATNKQDAQPDAGQTIADASADAGTAAKPAKPGVAKSGIVKTTVEDAASDIMASPDAAAPFDHSASTAVTPAPVAVAIVAVAITVPVAAAVVVAPLSNGSAPEPLAIAAAAIATSTSTVEASKPAVTTAQAPIDLATNAPASASVAAALPIAAPAPATASTNAPDPIAAASNTAQAAASSTAVVPSQPAAKIDVIAQGDPRLTTAVATAAPVVAIAPKAAPKTITARGSESAAPIQTSIASDAADPSATPPSSDAADNSLAPQGLAAVGKQKADGIAIDAAKTDPASANAPAAAATASPHEHRAAAAQVQAEPSDAVQVANAVQQPQTQSAATVPAAAHSSVTAATSAMVPLNGLALQIAVTAQSGNSRFEIRLDPAELGRIDVRIDVDRHGQLTSHLTVEKPETLAMLRQDAPQLQRALDNAGFKTGEAGLQFSLRDQSSSGQNNGNETGRNAHRLIISEDDSVPAAVAGRTYGRMPGSGSGVDIRV